MLFSKNILPRCAYCQLGRPLGGAQIICVKKGVMTVDDSCRKFRYDPLKRVPPRPKTPDFSRLKEDDFLL